MIGMMVKVPQVNDYARLVTGYDEETGLISVYPPLYTDRKRDKQWCDIHISYVDFVEPKEPTISIEIEFDHNPNALGIKPLTQSIEPILVALASLDDKSE